METLALNWEVKKILEKYAENTYQPFILLSLPEDSLNLFFNL